MYKQVLNLGLSQSTTSSSISFKYDCIAWIMFSQLFCALINVQPRTTFNLGSRIRRLMEHVCYDTELADVEIDTRSGFCHPITQNK
jgi:hypothetical protein